MMYKHISKIMLALLVTPLTTTATGQENEEEVIDDETRACISVRQIRKTHVVDDQNILFYMRGGTVYHNMLPRRCTMLRRERRFMYETRTGGLCRMENIRVLTDNIIGGGLMGGVFCSLGAFRKLSDEDVEALKMAMKKPSPEARPLPMPAPGEVDAADDES